MDTGAPRPDPTPRATTTAEPPAVPRRITITVTTQTLWVGALIVLTIVAAIFLLFRARGPITLLILAIILGEAIRPLVARLKRRRVPGALAVLLIYLVALLAVGALLWLLLSPLLNEVSAFSRDLPRYLIQLQEDVHSLERALRVQGSVNAAIDTLTQSLSTVLRDSIPGLLSLPFNALTGLFTLFIDLVLVLTMALFWLMSSDRLKAFVVELFPVGAREHADLVIREIGRGFGGYVRGLLISMALIGLISGVGLTILGIPYALLLGFLAGLTSLLPYIGPWISGAIAVLVTLVALGPAKTLEVGILFLLVFVFEGEVVQPLVMSRAVRVDPLVVIVAVLIGLSLLGLIGAILAVPLVAGAQVLLLRVVAPAIRRASDKA